ncbi:O-methyltransferase [uncultured Eubacterium sp.]|uniref:O-methyltransferase n=1 Tax=uncultured Eubacterium sp. TaxID=165185 RepID=UPI0025948029|nr:O-methyltransferase [uncultured Eubacterium sp.]
MPGSDQTINYQIRPSKSIERKILCELVKEIQILEGNRELRYIGLGAKYFTDFLLIHNEFGVTDMISIESEISRQVRYEFNKPLKCIQMRYGSTNDILPQIGGFGEKTNLIWLDYDDAFSEYMLYDIETICRNIDTGSMFFISCNYSFKGENQSQKMENFKERIGNFFDEKIEKKMYTNKNIPFVIRRIMNTQISRIIEKRNILDPNDKVEYLQLLFLTYKDGAPMLTIGGILANQALKEKIVESNLNEKYKYISSQEDIFNIDIPKLTNKEIQIILQNIPVSKSEYETRKDEFYGITYDEIEKFEKIYRYYPYYAEGQFNT